MSRIMPLMSGREIVQESLDKRNNNTLNCYEERMNKKAKKLSKKLKSEDGTTITSQIVEEA